MSQVFLILHNLRSVHNVGSIFRTADAAGVTKIYLVGCTPTPIDRFGRVRKDMAKVALGAETSMPWEYCRQINVLLRALRAQKLSIVAVEQDKHSVDYRTFKPKKAVAFILGNEVTGIPKGVLALCDTIVEIPMHGKKESLNVSVSAGIVLFQYAKH